MKHRMGDRSFLYFTAAWTVSRYHLNYRLKHHDLNMPCSFRILLAYKPNALCSHPSTNIKFHDSLGRSAGLIVASEALD